VSRRECLASVSAAVAAMRMPALANSRHELFAQAVASGKSASEGYRQSGANGKNADVHAARLMVNDGICQRVAELKAAQSQKSELSRDQVRQFLTEVILTPAGKVDEHSRLCQHYKVTPDIREIRMPDKLRAVEQLAKLCGWNEPEKLEHGADNELMELLKRLRGGAPG
jgi:hypothetical protein